MKYNFVINRIRKVIKSCTTLEQIEVSKNYTARILEIYIKELSAGGDDLSKYFLAKEKRKELIKWAGALLKKQKVEIRF